MIYNKNLLLLTLAFLVQLVTKSWSLPLQDKMKIVRSLRGGKRSTNTEIRRSKRTTISYTAFLYARHTNKFIRVTKDGVNALARDKNDKHAELIVEQRGTKGQHSIKGKESQQYICMNSKGKVILESDFAKNKLDCTFIEVYHHSGYVTYRSLHNGKWHLGFKKKGDIKHGHITKHHHHAAWMVKMRPTTKPST